jgi:invasion protein IalB
MASPRLSLAALGVSLAATLALSASAFAQQPAAKPGAKPGTPAPAAQAPATPAAPAAAAAPGGAERVELIPTSDAAGKDQPWTKICGEDKAAKKEICYTTRDFAQKKDEPPVLALAIYDVKGEDERIVRLLLPVALMIEPGARLIVDKGQPIEARYAICFPNGCFAETRVKGATISQMKAGTTLSIQVKNQVGDEVTFVAPLKDFKEAFDGKPMDPAELERKQKELEDQLQQQAEAIRKNLEAQGKGAAPAAPAAPAPKP